MTDYCVHEQTHLPLFGTEPQHSVSTPQTFFNLTPRSGGGEESPRLLLERGTLHDIAGVICRTGKVSEEPGGILGAEEIEVSQILLRLQPGSIARAQPGI